jgi:type II secretory pathway pseudopilin PulG
MKSTKCPACGFVGWSDLEHCKACGVPFSQRAVYAAQANPAWNEPEGQKKGLAIASLVLGIIGFVTFGIFGIGAIVGIILAIVAMNRVKSEPWKYGGRGMAIAGLVLSITSIVTVIPVGIIAAIAIPNLLQARMAANEGAAIYSLRTLSAAELTYQAQFQRFATLEELAEASLIDPKLGSGTKSGYRFTVELTSESSATEFGPTSGGFAVKGVPVDYRSSGRRSFFVDETQVIRAADNVGLPASADDPPLETRPLRAGFDRY